MEVDGVSDYYGAVCRVHGRFCPGHDPAPKNEEGVEPSCRQGVSSAASAGSTSAPSSPIADRPSLRFAYADPPYIGMAWRYPEHPESVRYDDPAEHIALMREMDAEYDGWALSCHEPSLGHLAATARELDARIAAWVKPFAVHKAHVRIAYKWEPVIWKRTAPRREGDPFGRDFLSCNITLRKGTVGAKPESFARWLLVLLGWQMGDEVVDLFPGSGVIGRVANENRLAL